MPGGGISRVAGRTSPEFVRMALSAYAAGCSGPEGQHCVFGACCSERRYIVISSGSLFRTMHSYELSNVYLCGLLRSCNLELHSHP